MIKCNHFKAYSLMTFDNDALLVRRIMFTLGEEFNDGELETLLKDLEDHGFRVVYVEEMKNKGIDVK